MGVARQAERACAMCMFMGYDIIPKGKKGRPRSM